MRVLETELPIRNRATEIQRIHRWLSDFEAAVARLAPGLAVCWGQDDTVKLWYLTNMDVNRAAVAYVRRMA